MAEEDGAVTGVAALRTEWLDALYVLPQWWNRGVGRALHDEVLARQIGVCWRRTADDVVWTPLPMFHFNAIVTAILGPLIYGGQAAIERRFYERLGWAENGSSRVVPFPPKPIDVGYSIAL